MGSSSPYGLGRVLFDLSVGLMQLGRVTFGCPDMGKVSAFSFVMCQSVKTQLRRLVEGWDFGFRRG
eukprot:1395471-Amorphochlora_amoeboformis.AAC.2